MFAIDSSTGQIQVGTGTTLNYEATTSYSVTVTAGSANAATIGVTINVTDVAEAPAAPAAPSVSKGSDPQTSLDVSWTAPDMTGKPAITGYDVQYKKSDDSTWTSHGVALYGDVDDPDWPGKRHHLRGAGEGQERRGREPLVGERQ